MHSFRNFRWGVFLLSLAAVGLVGCGGGGDDEDDDEDWDFDADASGIWRGSITPDGGGSAGTATLIAIPNGRFNMSSTVALFTGTGATSGLTFVGTGTGFSRSGSFGNGATSATFTFNGQVAELSGIQGAYSGGGISGTFNLEYSRAFTERPASLLLVNGNYAVQTGEGGPTVSIDINNGALTYTSSTGCVANGSIQPVESGRNMYSWNMTLSASCATSGAYTGLGFMPDNTRLLLTGSGTPGGFSALGVK